jgi:hypothetical protein
MLSLNLIFELESLKETLHQKASDKPLPSGKAIAKSSPKKNAG